MGAGGSTQIREVKKYERSAPKGEKSNKPNKCAKNVKKSGVVLFRNSSNSSNTKFDAYAGEHGTSPFTENSPANFTNKLHNGKFAWFVQDIHEIGKWELYNPESCARLEEAYLAGEANCMVVYKGHAVTVNFATMQQTLGSNEVRGLSSTVNQYRQTQQQQQEQQLSQHQNKRLVKRSLIENFVDKITGTTIKREVRVKTTDPFEYKSDEEDDNEENNNDNEKRENDKVDNIDDNNSNNNNNNNIDNIDDDNNDNNGQDKLKTLKRENEMKSVNKRKKRKANSNEPKPRLRINVYRDERKVELIGFDKNLNMNAIANMYCELASKEIERFTVVCKNVSSTRENASNTLSEREEHEEQEEEEEELEYYSEEEEEEESAERPERFEWWEERELIAKQKEEMEAIRRGELEPPPEALEYDRAHLTQPWNRSEFYGELEDGEPVTRETIPVLHSTTKVQNSALFTMELNTQLDFTHSARNRDEAIILAGGKSNVVTEYNLRSGQVCCRYKFDGLFEPNCVLNARIANSGYVLVACSDDSTARIFRRYETKPELMLKGHKNKVYDVYFSHDDEHVYTVSMDGALRNWNLSLFSNPKYEEEYIKHANEGLADMVPTEKVYQLGNSHLFTLALSPVNPNIMLAGGSDGVITMVDLREENGVVQRFAGHTEAVWCCRFSRDVLLESNIYNSRTYRRSSYSIYGTDASNQFASCGLDGTVRLWDVRKSEKMIHVINPHNGQPVHHVEFTYSNQGLLSSGKDGCVTLTDANTGNCIWRAKTSNKSCFRVHSQLPGNNAFVVCSSDGLINVWRWKGSKFW